MLLQLRNGVGDVVVLLADDKLADRSLGRRLDDSDVEPSVDLEGDVLWELSLANGSINSFN